MRIEIASRFRLYSHTPGLRWLMPRTKEWVDIFPTKLRFFNSELDLPLTGPIYNFTVENDLEKGWIKVFGKTPAGYFEYQLEATPLGVVIAWRKPYNEKRVLFQTETIYPSRFERLSFGLHKAQEWDLIRRRNDLGEIFPIWLRIADWLPATPEENSYLLKKCEELLDNKNSIAGAFQNLFQASFKGVFYPTAQDELHLGLIPPETSPISKPFGLLKKSDNVIRSLFFQEPNGRLKILPHLPKEFDHGRFCSIETHSGHVFHFEWTKRLLRQLMIECRSDGFLIFQFQKELKSFRLRKSPSDKGTRHQRDEPIPCRVGEILYLDRFEK